MPVPGSVKRMYLFTCALCGEAEEFYSAAGSEITKARAESGARNDGWTKHSRLGWAHRACVKRAEEEVFVFSSF